MSDVSAPPSTPSGGGADPIADMDARMAKNFQLQAAMQDRQQFWQIRSTAQSSAHELFKAAMSKV